MNIDGVPDLNHLRTLIDVTFPAIAALLMMIFGIMLVRWMVHMIQSALDMTPSGDIPQIGKRKQKPIELKESSDSDEYYEEKPKRGAWALGDDGEIISLDDLGIEADNTKSKFYHRNN